MILFLKRFSMLNMLNCAVQCQWATHTHAPVFLLLCFPFFCCVPQLYLWGSPFLGSPFLGSPFLGSPYIPFFCCVPQLYLWGSPFLGSPYIPFFTISRFTISGFTIYTILLLCSPAISLGFTISGFTIYTILHHFWVHHFWVHHIYHSSAVFPSYISGVHHFWVHHIYHSSPFLGSPFLGSPYIPFFCCVPQLYLWGSPFLGSPYIPFFTISGFTISGFTIYTILLLCSPAISLGFTISGWDFCVCDRFLIQPLR